MKTGVIINFLGLVGLVFVFEYAKQKGWGPLLIGCEAGFFALLIISYITTYIRSKVWQFTHMPIKKQDERELELTSNTLRISYSLFAIISLSVFLALAVLEIKVSIIVVVALIYLAHIIPASILAWRNKLNNTIEKNYS